MKAFQKAAVFILCLVFPFALLSAAPVTIVSPAPGVWANEQPLVLILPEGAEAYYSVTGTNPLVSGIAYDGPVLLDETGQCTVAIAISFDDGSTELHTVSYRVAKKQVPDFLKISGTPAIIELSEAVSYTVPQKYRWTVNSSVFTGAAARDGGERGFQQGGTIGLQGASSISSYAELLVSDGTSFFRYIVSLAESQKGLVKNKPVPAVRDIEFSEWNWVRFYDGAPVLYSIDEGPWRQTSKPVYIDRTQNHTITWKLLRPATPYDEELPVDETVHTLYIPSKFTFWGLPEKGFTNQAVTLRAPSSSYVFEYETPSGETRCATSFSADVLFGDSRGFSQVFTVYYRGIKQGTMPASFVIDKRAPETPRILSTAASPFSRSAVSLSMEKNDDVFVCVQPVAFEEYGFTPALYREALSAIDTVVAADRRKLKGTDGTALPSYELFDAATLTLEPSLDGAIVYLVTAFSVDPAGNRSDLSSYHVLIDAQNFYVSAQTAGAGSAEPLFPVGFSDNPYHSLSDALSALRDSKNPRLFVSGTFDNLGTLLVQKKMSFFGLENARFRFTEQGLLSVVGCDLSLANLVLEKHVPRDRHNTQLSLVSVTSGSLEAVNVDFVGNLGENGTAIVAESSTLVLDGVLASVQCVSYASFVSAGQSQVTVRDSEIFVSGKTSMGVSLSESPIVMQNTAVNLAGALVQALGITRSRWLLSNCVFTDKNATKQTPAVWYDLWSTCVMNTGNRYEGFESLLPAETR